MKNENSNVKIEKTIIKINMMINIYKYFIIFLFMVIYVCILNFKSIIIDNKKFIIEIEKEFSKNGKVNINKIENEIKCIKYNNSMTEKNNNTINIGFTLDPRYILQTMLTMTSIMATQRRTTKIIFHLGVVNNFTAKNMIKIDELRRKINNLTEFNFYYLKGAMEKMKHFHSKGEACPGKFELPELLSNDIDKLFIFDAGDVLVFRDLTELYNYNMEEYWALGTPEPTGIILCSKYYNLTKYLNIGSILLNAKELKKNNFWDTYTKNRYLKLIGAPDQALFNILIPDNKKGYFPLRFGGIAPFLNDKDFDNLKIMEMGMSKWLMSELGNSLPEYKKNQSNYIVQLFNPVFIHQFSEKWKDGSGLSIYRNLAKYFINLAGISDELCKIEPGYCY